MVSAVAGEVVRRGVSGRRQPGARFALLTLTGVNLLNFADRYVAASVKELIKNDLGLTDAETALPTTGMVAVYMVCAVGFGFLADRNVIDRRKLLAGGVFLWSLATALAGFSQNLWQLILFRSLVGVGEAAYGVITTPMLGDFYPPHERNMAYAIYNMAIPFGGALGYGAGAILGSYCGWRSAFSLVGFPGMVVAFTLLLVRDPERGIQDGAEDLVETCDGSAQAEPVKPQQSFTQDLRRILSNQHYLVATSGLVAAVFAIGGLADWVASFLQRYDGASLSQAGLAVGAITALAGIMGNVLGAKTAEHLEDRCKNALFLAPALFMLPGAMLACTLVNVTGNMMLAFALLFPAQVCFWTYLSPIASASISVMPVSLRARSCGLQIFFTHILGDVISPPIIGFVSDATGSLRMGLQVTWCMILVAGFCWFCGYAFLPPLPQPKLSEEVVVPTKDASRPRRSPTSLSSLLCDVELQDDPNSDFAETEASSDVESGRSLNSSLAAEGLEEGTEMSVKAG